MNEFLNILRYRKTPGLVSAIYFLHNLVYADCQIIRQRDNQNHMDACLEMLADILRVEQDCDMPAKDILHARKHACLLRSGCIRCRRQAGEKACSAGKRLRQMSVK